MADDDRPSPDPNIRSQKLTVKVDALESSSVREMPTAKLDAVTVRRKPADGTTEMLSRDDLFKNAVEDRANQRGRKTTTPAGALSSFTPEEAARLQEEYQNRKEQPPVVTETIPLADRTVESEAYCGADAPADVTMELDGTNQFARHTIGTADRGSQELEFPGRVEEDLRIAVPLELAHEIGLQPGDLVMICLRKVGG